MAEDEDFGSIGSFGIGNVLRESGIDISGFNSLFSKTGGQTSSSLAQADIDTSGNDDQVKYMDDEMSDEDMGQDEEGERIRAAREVEEARMYRRALAMQQRMEGAEAVAERKRKAVAREESAQETQRRVWPDYERGTRVRMSEVFYETPLHRRQVEMELQKRKRAVREKVEHRFKVAAPPTTTPLSTFLEATIPDLDIVDPRTPNYLRPIGRNFAPEWLKGAKEAKRKEMKSHPEGMSLVDGEADRLERDEVEKTLDLAEWEQDIVYDSFSQNYRPPASSAQIGNHPRNDFLIKGDWVKDVIWDATRVLPELVESDDEVEIVSERAKGKKGDKKTKKLDPFNISNDHLYEQPREARFRIRQTFGSIEVFHAGPAKALQMPFYRTTLSKAEARAWRRPPLQFPVGIPLTFSKLKSNPSSAVNSKKKAMISDPSERFQKTKDLTLTEKGPYVLLEFSEEYPPIMSGYGMGTTIVNYYRKKDEKDEHVPKLDFGQPSILNVGDADPFLLGYVDKGKVTQVIHNNLLRAPIFRHTPETTDFLVIRQTIGTSVNYYIRAINNVFVVGQTTPNQSEVPGPHARKSTNTAKQRLQIIAWLLIQKSPHKNLDLPRLLKYFPDQTELQMRQRLKIKGNEFLLYSRDPGPNQGHWILNPAYNWPKERKEVLEQCTPEMAMLYEAMQVGARHLYDAGYTKTAEGKEEEEMGADDPTGLDIEQQLAVWSTTLNYKRAEGQKAWLVVHGPGEPTGRGEGFSFLRTNMKSYFLRKGETEQGRRLEAERKADGAEVKISNAAQQVIYEEEKRKVWDLQWKALSNPAPPELTPEDEVEEQPVNTALGFAPASRFNRADSRRAQSRGASMVMESPRDRSPSAFSNDGESAFTGNVNNNRVLRIRRVDKKGKETVQIVRDPAVIAQYLKRREEARLAYYAENPDRLAEILEPTGNPEEDEFRRIALRQNIEKAKKNQMRRAARKKSMKGELEVYEGDETGKRKCGACGMIGHTKANRMCPKYQASVGPSPAGGTPTVPTPGGGYGMPFTPIDVPETAPTTSLKIRLGGVRPQ